MADFRNIRDPPRLYTFQGLGTVTRLGLATRGNTCLDREDVLEAVARGVNFLNWCGYPDGLSAAVRKLGKRRRDVVIAVQMNARSASAAARELEAFLGELQTDYLDVVTYFYVENEEEWAEISGRNGARETLERARQVGRVRAIGLTSHQRRLAAQIAASGDLDVLMVRYNAAHRAAEEAVFPLTMRLGIPVVTYTGLRWGALPKSTPDDPPGFEPPAAPEWYRFVLCHPGVAVGLMAPNDREELEEDLAILADWRGFSREQYFALCAHGDRVHRHAGRFP